MTSDKYEELAMLRRLAKRPWATTQRYHNAMRSIAAALSVNDLAMIHRVLHELGYTLRNIAHALRHPNPQLAAAA